MCLKNFLWHLYLTGSSCTDLPVTWGTGNLEVVNPATINSMSFNTQKLTNVPLKAKNNISANKYLPTFLDSQSALNEMVEKSKVKELFYLRNTILCHTISKPILVPEGNIPAAVMLYIHTEHDYDFTKPVTVTCTPCQAFYSKYVI